MAKGWYVVHTYSGYENKVERHIRKLVESDAFRGAVLDIKVPAEDVVEVKEGKKRVVSRKFLPGYILVEMDLPDLGWKSVCAEMRKIQGVTGFVGSSSGTKPQPISSEEARTILQKAGDIKADKQVLATQSFTLGESVRIVDGPFDTFTGSVEDVNAEKGKLRVMVGIFGRATPVEVDFNQVEKI